MTPEEVAAQKGLTWANLAEKTPNRPVRFKTLHSMATQLIAAVKSRDARIQTLEARIDALEQRPRMEYRGIWGASESYRVGDFVTEGGCVWHCNQAHVGIRPTFHDPSQPREFARVWTLSVKKGRDAR